MRAWLAGVLGMAIACGDDLSAAPEAPDAAAAVAVEFPGPCHIDHDGAPFEPPLDARTTFRYDDAGWVIEREQDGPPGGAIEHRITYTRDGAGRELVSETDEGGDGVIELRVTHAYDDEGRVASVLRQAPGQLDLLTTYDYDPSTPRDRRCTIGEAASAAPTWCPSASHSVRGDYHIDAQYLYEADLYRVVSESFDGPLGPDTIVGRSETRVTHGADDLVERIEELWADDWRLRGVYQHDAAGNPTLDERHDWDPFGEIVTRVRRRWNGWGKEDWVGFDQSGDGVIESRTFYGYDRAGNPLVENRHSGPLDGVVDARATYFYDCW